MRIWSNEKPHSVHSQICGRLRNRADLREPPAGHNVYLKHCCDARCQVAADSSLPDVLMSDSPPFAVVCYRPQVYDRFKSPSFPEGYTKEHLILISLSEEVNKCCSFFFFSLIQITTSLEQHVTESSLCDRNTTAGLSTQGEEAALTFTNKVSAFAPSLVNMHCIKGRSKLLAPFVNISREGEENLVYALCILLSKLAKI